MSVEMKSLNFLPLWISLGAILGALSRYYLTLLFIRWASRNFPLGTFIVNISGAIMIGAFATLLQMFVIEASLAKFVVVGFLGSYTTFSTYTLDTINLLKQGSYKQALLYGAGSPIAGLLGVEIGIRLPYWLQY